MPETKMISAPFCLTLPGRLIIPSSPALAQEAADLKPFSPVPVPPR